MIKDTFYNLPSEKKERIINAINSEFNKNSIDKISINSIIKEANISRGSFYHYFDDKGDLYDIVADEFFDSLRHYLEECFEKNKGDLFQTTHDTVLAFIDILSQKKINKRFKNFLPGVSANARAVIDRVCYKFNIYYDILVQKVNTENLSLTSPDELRYLFQLIISIIRDISFEMTVAKIPKEEVLLHYQKKISIIKRGCIKEN